MLGSDDPYAAFSSPVDNTTSTPAPIPQVAAPSGDISGHVKALIDSGASKDQVHDYIKSQKQDPGAYTNLDANIDARDAQIAKGVHEGAVVNTYVPGQAQDVGATPPSAAPVAQNDPYAAISAPVDAASAAPDAQPQQAQTIADGLGGGVRNILEGGGQLLDTVTSPIKAGMAAIGLPVTPYADDAAALADKLGLSHIDGVTGAIQKGLAEGLLSAGTAAPLAAAPGVTGAVAGALADTPIAQAVSSGAAAGSGEAAKEAGAGSIGQTAASLVGGLGGAGLAVGANVAAQRVGQAVDPNEILAAFQRQNAANIESGAKPIQPIAANVGGFGSKMMTAATKATLGGLPLAAAAEKTIAGAMAMRNRIAGTIGKVAPDDVAAGQTMIRGANNLIDTTATRGGKLYDAIPLAGTKQATLSNTRQALTDLNAGLSSNEELSKLIADKRLQGFEAAIKGRSEEIPTGLLDADGKPIMRTVQKGGQLSWQDLKAFRTYVGEIAGRPTFQDNTSKEALQSLYGALSADMRSTAAADSPKALQAFERANTYWRARQDRIDNTLLAIIGKDGRNTPESAFAQIQRWSKEGGNFAAVGRALRSLSPDEADQVRATIFSRLGNAPIRGQGEEATFSPNYFLKHWTALDPRAKAVLFPGEKYRADLNDIANISKSLVASEAFTNTSRTALAAHLGGNLLGAGALALISHPLAIMAESTGYVAGHLLANPRFAAWLASSVRKPPGPAALAHINRLTAIATAEPAIANEVLALQHRLAEAFIPSRAAADKRDKQ